MSRLIDADKLAYEILEEFGDAVKSEEVNKAVDDIYGMVINAPTIDAVSVVRCKDCKYWHDHITTTWCSRGAELRPQESGWVKRDADDFCSYGEREGE